MFFKQFLFMQLCELFVLTLPGQFISFMDAFHFSLSKWLGVVFYIFNSPYLLVISFLSVNEWGFCIPILNKKFNSKTYYVPIYKTCMPRWE